MCRSFTRSTGAGSAWGWLTAITLAGAGCPTHPPDLPLAATLGDGDSDAPAADPDLDPDQGWETDDADASTSSGDASDSSDAGSSGDDGAAADDPMSCDVFAQDCGDDEKCMPVANDGGSAWNATRCRPLDPSPDPIGSSCTAQANATSGLDSCEAGTMCWNLDEALEGTCIELCGGSADDPTCQTEGSSCVFSNGGVLAVCLASCSPLDADACAPTEGCYLSASGPVCAPDASGGAGAQDDPCEAINACDPGLFCVDAMAVPGCSGDVGCCSAACDLSMPATCPASTTCVSIFVDGMAPPDLVDLGVCVSV